MRQHRERKHDLRVIWRRKSDSNGATARLKAPRVLIDIAQIGQREGCFSHSILPGRKFMGILISALITFLVVILVLYLVNMLPIDGRAKQIVRVIVIIIGILSLLRYLAVF
jgi:hypothetical protein